MRQFGWLVVLAGCGGGVIPAPEAPLWEEDTEADDWVPPAIDEPVGEPLRCQGAPALFEACVDGPAAFVAGTGYDTVQEAVDAASTDQTVYVCPGTWGSVDVTGQLAIRGVNPGRSVLTGGADRPAVVAEGADVLLDGLVIRNGNRLSAEALDAEASVVRVRCSTLEATAVDDPAASLIRIDDSTLYLDTTTLSVATPPRLGIPPWGISVGAVGSEVMSLFLDNVTVLVPTFDVASSSTMIVIDGGSDRDTVDADVAIRRTRLRGVPNAVNRSHVALFARELDLVVDGFQSEGDSPVSSTLLASASTVRATIADATFSNGDGSFGSTVSFFGGPSVDVDIRDSTFADNQGSSGAALSILGGDVDLEIEDSEFSRNTATDNGGAVSVGATGQAGRRRASPLDVRGERRDGRGRPRDLGCGRARGSARTRRGRRPLERGLVHRGGRDHVAGRRCRLHRGERSR